MLVWNSWLVVGEATVTEKFQMLAGRLDERGCVCGRLRPVALVEQHLRNSSRRGEIVLDPFAGSGTTLIAAEKTGRSCHAIEIDPAYCDVIRSRYDRYQTGAS